MKKSPLIFTRSEVFLGLLLAGAVLLAYAPVWHAGFIWDDDSHLTENPCIVGPLGFKGIWTTAAATYYPLALTTFWLGHALWGLAPLPFHLLNVLMHTACGLLLWVVLRRLRVPGALLGAALWALHPVNVESVAWVTELKNTQSCLFYLLAVWCFLQWRETKARPRYLLAMLCAAAAILSKSSTVMLPIVLGLCIWWQEERFRWREVARALWPFFLISVTASGWTIWEQKFHSGALGMEWAQTWPERMIIAGRATWFYLGKLVWPHPLIFIYPRWTIDASQPLAYVPAGAAIGGLAVLWWRRMDWGRPFLFAAAYFVVSLFPVLGFFAVYFFLYSFVGDHFQYLASMGPLALAGAGWSRLPEFFRGTRASMAAALLLALGILSWRQAEMYETDEKLWTETLGRNPDCWLGHNNLGFELFTAGQLREALAHFQQAIALRPNYADAHNNLGLVLFQMGQSEQAVARWRKTIEFAPRYAFAYNNLALALFKMGKVEEALTHWQRALEVDPDYAEARKNLHIAQDQKKETDAKAHYDSGMALAQKGAMREAMAEWEKTIELLPANGSAPNELAWALATSPDASLRDGPRALALAELAVELSGGSDPAVLDTLAAAQAECGDFSNAVKTAQRALALATRSSNAKLVEALRKELNLYQAGVRFRVDGQIYP